MTSADASYQRVFQEFEKELGAGREEQALRLLEEARRRALPAEEDVVGWLGRYQLALYFGEFDEAERIGEKILDRTRRFEDIQRLLPRLIPAADLSAPGRHAQDYLTRLLDRLDLYRQRRPDSPWGPYFSIGIGHARRRSHDGDLKDLARTAGPRYVWMRRDLGKNKLIAGDVDGALREFEAVRDYCRPGDWLAECHVGEARLLRGGLREMTAAFARAEELAPAHKREEIRAWKGQMLLWSGRYARALSVLSRVPESSPYALCWKGAALYKLGRKAQALTVLDATLSRSPDDLEARIWRGEVLLSLGRRDEARRDVDAAIAVAPQSGYAHVLRALLHHADARAEEMRRECELIRRSFPAPLSELWSPSEPLSAAAVALRRLLALSRGVRSSDGAFAAALFARARRAPGRRASTP